MRESRSSSDDIEKRKRNHPRERERDRTTLDRHRTITDTIFLDREQSILPNDGVKRSITRPLEFPYQHTEERERGKRLLDH